MIMLRPYMSHLPLIWAYSNPRRRSWSSQPNEVLTANVTDKKTGSNLKIQREKFQQLRLKLRLNSV